MSDNLKESISDWLRLLTASLAASAIVGGSLWFVIKAKGDENWGSIESVEALEKKMRVLDFSVRSAVMELKENAEDIEEHAKDEDFHMPEKVKRTEYIPRVELELIVKALSQQLENIKSQAAIGRSEQNLNWKRQQDFNDQLTREFSKKKR